MPTARKKQTKPDRILITGASGELGAALARRYAAPGTALLLWGRDIPRLTRIAEECRRAGADCSIRSLDLADAAGAVAAIEAEDDAAPIALAIFAAGVGDICADAALVEDPAQVVRLALVNFVAPCAMAAALADRMAKRRRGAIVLIGSAAAFYDLPFATAYAGSKAGLARFAQALRIGVAVHGVHVMLASPGFIDTAAGRRVAGPKPLLMQPADVAERIASAVAKRQPHLILPRTFALLRIVVALLPRRLRDRLLLGLTPATN